MRIRARNLGETSGWKGTTPEVDPNTLDPHHKAFQYILASVLGLDWNYSCSVMMVLQPNDGLVNLPILYPCTWGYQMLQFLQ